MPVAASAIYFLNLRGDVLINRLYRDDVGYVVPSWACSCRSGAPVRDRLVPFLARSRADRERASDVA
jgi:hypothetical protein